MKSQSCINVHAYTPEQFLRHQTGPFAVAAQSGRRRLRCISRIHLAMFAALFALLMTSSISRADMPLNQVITEEMIEYQGDAAGFLGIAFGPDSGSPLQYTSNVNVGGGSFFYSLNAGQTYLGLPLSLSGSGTFDPVGKMMNLTASGQYGSQAFLISGSDHLTFNADGSVTRSAGFDFLVDQVKVYDRHEITTYNSDGTSSSEGWFTNKDGDKIKGTDFKNTDKWDPNGHTSYGEAGIDGLAFYISSSGYSPIGGGDGSFTTIVASTPEPASLLLMGSAVVGVFAKLRTFRRP